MRSFELRRVVFAALICIYSMASCRRWNRATSDLPDEQVLFLSDIFSTGYMAEENYGIEPGDTVAIWGCSPVAQFAIQSAWMLGAARVIAIDRVPERLLMAEQDGKAETCLCGLSR